MEDLIQLFKNSLEDAVFSRTEKRDIKHLLKKKNYRPQELELLRHEIFNLAKEHEGKLSGKELVEWVEGAIKATIPKEKKDSYSEGYFSPGISVKSVIISHLRKANVSLRICVFTISDDEIAEEIIAAHRRGVRVKIVTDDVKVYDKGSDIAYFVKNGLKVKTDSTEYHMHHKFFVVDRKILLTGSYNWTRQAAENNQENMLVTTEKSVVKAYLSEFSKLWKQFHWYH
jgi:phosphatidylserine/phosphatidylglycerophosphate/cardiolipin synthase-like enzyme